jgi:hypothetical protein
MGVGWQHNELVMQILSVVDPGPSAPLNAPTSLSAIPTNTNVAISFTAPTNNGGSPITNYEYSFNNSSWTALSPADATSPVTVSGLTQNTAYTIYLRGVNVVGSGPGSTGVSFTTEGVPTGTPTITSVTVGNTTATVNYTYPGGGGAVTGWDLYVTGQTNAWNNTTASPISVTGLSAGTTYTFYVRAKNAYGTGPQSAGVSATTNQLTVQFFVLGGGGGGASASSWNSNPQGSGGGGGGITTSYGSTNGGGNAMSSALNGLAGTTQTVTVGGGGAGGAGNSGWSAGRGGSAGGSSQFASVVSTGGGAGRAEGGTGAAAGSLGYQNNASNNYWAIGGSSAAGSAGTNATRPGTPYGGIHGVPGNGITTAIYAGGGVTRGGAGGNGATQNSNGGVNVARTDGGAGGGGGGGGYGNSFAAATASAGATNYGAGGGSGSWYPYGGQGSGGAGGSGYVAIRYPNSYGTLTSISGGLAYNTTTDGSDRVYQFTSGTGTITFPSY